MEKTALPAYFGEWLKSRRKELDLTQVELARRVGCSLPGLRKIESGERRPSKQLAGLLAKSLEIAAEDQKNFIKVARGELSIERLSSPTFIRVPDRAIRQNSTFARNNLPFQHSPLIGRDAELATLGKLLAEPQCRLLTITGMGGIGKTRLAIEFASMQQAWFPDGVYFVSLASLDSANFIVPAIADVLNISLTGMLDPQEQLLNHLSVRARQAMLLVLDNLEHLLVPPAQEDRRADVTQLFVELLRGIPSLKILVTSREQIYVQGEWTFELQGLPFPAIHQTGSVENYSAPALFTQHARRVRADFKVLPEERSSLVKLCQMVEGSPLAIELAAAWIGILSVGEIAQEIEANRDFLTATMRDIPERHRSLRVVFEHSWGLLSDEERRVLGKLAVFRGGFQREAARQVAEATLPLLSALMSKSFLYRSAADRYDLHELIRHYALEKLIKSGEFENTCYNHLVYLVVLAQAARDELRGPHQTKWYDRLEDEYDNIRAALAWAFAPETTAERVQLGLQLVIANVRFWQGRGHIREGIDWLDRGLQVNQPVSPAARAKALSTAGWLVCYLSDCQRASTLLNESIALYSQLNDERGLARALDIRGDIAWLTGDFAAGKNFYEESLALFRKLDIPGNIGLSLYSAGRLHVDNGYYQEGESLLLEALSILQDIQDWRGIAMCKNGLGRVALLKGNLEEAGALFREALRLNYELGHKVALTECLQELAMVALRIGQEPRAIHLWSVATAVREGIGVNLPYNDPIYRQVPLSWFSEIPFSPHWAEGQTTSLEQAIKFALFS